MPKFKIINLDQCHSFTHYVYAPDAQTAMSHFKAGHYGAIVKCELAEEVNMTKVEHTKTHILSRETNKTNYGFDQKVDSVLVTEAKLVLVEASLAHCYVIVGGKGYKPILISGTEKIEVGDWYRVELRVHKCTEISDDKVFIYSETGHPSYRGECFKILARPEHFSPQQLQDIVDGKLKDGDKVLVECIFYNSIPEDNKEPKYWKKQFKIKLNPHITIYPVSQRVNDIFIVLNTKGGKDGNLTFVVEAFNTQSDAELCVKDKPHLIWVSCPFTIYPVEEKMYTRLEVRTILHKFNNPQSNEDVFRVNTWFEQNVK